MINNLSLPSPPLQVHDQALPTTVHQLSTLKNDVHITTSPSEQQKLSPSYLSLPISGNRCFAKASDFQDPLFYQQPLHLDHNRSISSTTKSGHERGDRVLLSNKLPSTEQRRGKNKSSQRKCTISRQKNEQRKKPSTRRVIQRNRESRKNSRINTRQLRRKTKSSQELLRKRRRQREAVSKKNKKQRTVSKRRSTSTHHSRGKNVNNHRTISSRRSLSSKFPRSPFKVRSKATTVVVRRSPPSNKNSTTSTTRLLTNGNCELVSKKTKEQTNPSASHPRMNEVTPNKPTWTTDQSSSPATTDFNQKLSKNNLRHSKSKQLKRQSHGSTKLHIRSPTHTTLKKGVRYHRKGISQRHRTKFPPCTSKTLITIAPSINRNDQTSLKSNDTNNGECRKRSSASLVSSKKHLMNKFSSTSTVMPLTKNMARITSKNNNKRALKPQRRRHHLLTAKSGSRVTSSMTKGMTLRSRTIMINK